MVTKTNNYIRVQVMLNESQKVFLDSSASLEGMSVSALLRELVDQYRLEQRDLRLKEAANELYSEYKTNNELTAFTSLDGEDFYEARGSLADKS
jgi:hypothetical protein